MASLTNAGIFYESGQSAHTFAEMTDAGAHTVHTLAAKPWSRSTGYEYVIAPYGLATGGDITPATTADKVNVATLSAMMPGATGASATTGMLTVGATADVTITRGATTNICNITSITVTTAGVIAAVAGTASTAFSETRGAAGGPPFIPVGSIEIGQVRTGSITAAVVTSAEVMQVVGSHQERYDYPVYSEDPISGSITFAAALPTIHTGSVAKKVYARVATPIFAEIPRAKDWKPAETSNSVSSEQYYDGAVGSFSSSLGQASFTASLNDGVTDALVAKKGSNLIFKFMPDKNKAPYQLTQGVLGVARTFGVGANPSVAVTVSSASASVDFAA
ncbi:hypothetical protein [Chromatium okenii]|uniref:hypothetical protein n=1 Tax=Chromatium okenii TaxID=61644 RepID=UPI0026EB9B2C|nr:hypothetical protein [Chromatium okenii]MBV5311541.1 hypothetical protein [Chromatium okenii]